MKGLKKVKITTMKGKVYIRSVYVSRKGEYIMWISKRLYLVRIDEEGCPMIMSYPWIKAIHTIDMRIKEKQEIKIGSDEWFETDEGKQLEDDIYGADEDDNF